jgi:hypothetical protein
MMFVFVDRLSLFPLLMLQLPKAMQTIGDEGRKAKPSLLSAVAADTSFSDSRKR